MLSLFITIPSVTDRIFDYFIELFKVRAVKISDDEPPSCCSLLLLLLRARTPLDALTLAALISLDDLS